MAVEVPAARAVAEREGAMVAEARAGSQAGAAMVTAMRGVVRVPETPDQEVRAALRGGAKLEAAAWAAQRVRAATAAWRARVGKAWVTMPVARVAGWAVHQ